MNLERYETWRLDAVHRVRRIDALSNGHLDRVIWVTKHHYGVADAWFTLVGNDRQWFKTQEGLTSSNIPAALSLSHRTIRHDALFVVEDASRHSDFACHPLVAGPPYLRFYAGVPVRDSEGFSIGTLCLAHTAPIPAGTLNFDMLQVLATLIEDEIDYRLQDSQLPALSQDHTDELTGLPNRRLLQTLLEAELAITRRRRGNLSVCLINLDDFKSINENHGNTVGDTILQIIAERLREGIRREDLVARMEADEFAVILHDALQPANCRRMLEQIRLPIETPGHVHRLTASIGITCYPGDDADADLLLRHAKQAMFTAKEAGKNGYCCFDLKHHHSRRERLAIARDVRLALSQRQLELFYQPKIDYHHDIVAGFEGLLRWRLPSGDILPPNHFLPYIEHTQLDIEVGKYVIDQALAALEEIMRRNLPYSISINVSPACFLDNGFIDYVHQAIAHRDQDLIRRLTLEILESRSPQDDTMSIVTNIQACLRLGLQLSLDDFGTGHASLSYLRTFPTQKVKIDRSFVLGMLDNPEDEAIVAAIIDLSKNFNRQVIAEGVENGLIEARLKSLGCDLGQGFYYSPALPFEDAIQWASAYRQR